MRAFTSFFATELKHSLRTPSNIIALGTQATLLFALIRFGMPADAQTSQSLPALLLGAMTISLLHIASGLFDEDVHQGRIAHWHYSSLSFEWIILVKYMVALLCYGIPLAIIFSALLMLQQGNSFSTRHLAIFLCSASAIIACGCFSAAIKLLFNQHHFIGMMLMLPFLISVIIFSAPALQNIDISLAIPAAFAICFPLCSIMLSSIILRKCY